MEDAADPNAGGSATWSEERQNNGEGSKDPVHDEYEEEKEHKEGGGDWQDDSFASSGSKLCDCGRPAALKVAGQRSENQGLRYLCCDRFVFFGKKKKRNYCRFFEWIDCPRVTKEQRKEARMAKRQKLSTAPSAALQPDGTTRATVRKHDNKCAHTDTRKFDILLEVSSVHQQTHSPNGQISSILEPSFAKKDQEARDWQEGSIADDAAGLHCQDHVVASEVVETHRTGCLNDTYMGNVMCVNGKMHASLPILDAQDASGDKQVCPGPSLSEVLKVKALEKQIEVSGNAVRDKLADNAFGSSEVPYCMCSRAAVYKTVKSKGPNQGLGFWVCSNSRPFYVKKRNHRMSGTKTSCKFFKWVGTPFVKSKEQRDEEKLKKKELLRRKELALLT